MRDKNAPAAFFLFALLLSIYLLSFNGIPISDDEQLFISIAHNYADTGSFSAPQLLGNVRLQGRDTSVGLIHAMLGALAYGVGKLFGFGGVQVLYLLTPFYTSLSAVFLFYLARHFGYERRIGILAGLFFGLGTIVWPYTQTFFREPLAMLAFIAAWYFFEKAVEETEGKLSGVLRWLAFIFCYGVALLAKIYFVITLPLFLLIFAKRKEWGDLNPKKRRDALRWIALITVVAVLIFFTVQALPDSGFRSRFSGNFIYHALGILQRRVERFDFPLFANAVLGILFSPAKGALIYSPILWLILYSMPQLARENRRMLWLPLTTFAGFIILQALAYRGAWWNITWGTRFLLPVYPILLVAALPGLQKVYRATSRTPKIILGALFGGSVLIQLGGVLVSDPQYLMALYDQLPEPDLAFAIWRGDLAPIFMHWRLLFAGVSPALAVWRTGVFSISATLPLLGMLILLLSLSGVSLWRLWMNKFDAAGEEIKLRIGIIGVTLLLVPLALLRVYRADPAHFYYRQDFNAANQYLLEHVQAGDIVVVDPYLGEFATYYMNFSSVRSPWYSLPDAEAGKRGALIHVFVQTADGEGTVWLVRPSQASPDWINTRTTLPYLIEDVQWQSAATYSDGILISRMDIAPKP